MKQLLIFIFISCIAAASQAQVNDKRITALEPQLQKLLTDWKAAGFAVAVVEKNKVIYSKGFGFRDVENKLPVTPNTLFAIGSSTKAFTTSLLGLLNQEKLVELDKPVRNYLPQLNFFNETLTNQVTLLDMMSHRTGLPRHDFSWYLFNSSPRDSLLERIRHLEPTVGLRNVWLYNNFMYFAQGMVAEKLTGKSWEQNIKDKIFAPLAMNRSNFSVVEMAKDKDAALGYGLKNDSIIKKLDYYNIDAMGPAGSINSSVNEMANWVITWINNGKFNGKEVLPEPFTKTAISSQMVIGPALPDSATPDVHFANYGLGWFLSSYRGHYRVEHGGNIDGFSANVAFFPTDSVGIVVLSNQNASPIPSLVRNIIADKLLQLKPTDWNGLRLKAVAKSKATAAEVKKTSTDPRKPGTSPTHPLNDYEGLYSHPGYGTFNVSIANDSLFAQASTYKIWLRHYHYNVFEPFLVETDGIDTASSLPMKFHFQMDVNGNIQSFLAPMDPALKPLEFVKKLKEVSVTAGELEKYTGEYELAGMTAKVYMKGNTLYLFVPGQPEYELAATGDHKFTFKALQGFSVEFHPDENGRITAVSFIQPNGTFRANKKGQ